MLLELHVANLGVIEEQRLVFGPGLTALSGETGAGKTLLVDAIALLTGAAADASLVRPGTDEALIEARFEVAGEERIVTRIVPASGRTRCYLDGRMVSLARLSELGADLVDIHGQHAHQSLLSPAAQRDALDRAGRIDTGKVEELRRRVRALRHDRDELGGDPQSRARQLDLLQYQLREIVDGAVDDPDEDARLHEEEELLGDAAGVAEAAGSAWQALAGDDGAVDQIGAAVAMTAGRPPLAGIHERLTVLQGELADVAGDARAFSEAVESDPQRLADIGERRRVLGELRRKYGGTLADVIAYRDELEAQVAELSSYDERAASIEADLAQAEAALAKALTRLHRERTATAPVFAGAVEAELRQLAMPRARFAVEVGDDPAKETVTWLLAANPGQPLQPLAKVASGGELARAMLAARLAGRRMERGDTGVLGRANGTAGKAAGEGGEIGAGIYGPETLVFDEVDAGIGGEAAVAVGRALAAIGADHQVLVVTHLAQVAACAEAHLAVAKEVVGEATVARTTALGGETRVVELARMLSGQPDSDVARKHAETLLASAPSAVS